MHLRASRLLSKDCRCSRPIPLRKARYAERTARAVIRATGRSFRRRGCQLEDPRFERTQEGFASGRLQQFVDVGLRESCGDEAGVAAVFDFDDEVTGGVDVVGDHRAEKSCREKIWSIHVGSLPSLRDFRNRSGIGQGRRLHPRTKRFAHGDDSIMLPVPPPRSSSNGTGTGWAPRSLMREGFRIRSALAWDPRRSAGMTQDRGGTSRLPAALPTAQDPRPAEFRGSRPPPTTLNLCPTVRQLPLTRAPSAFSGPCNRQSWRPCRCSSCC